MSPDIGCGPCVRSVERLRAAGRMEEYMVCLWARLWALGALLGSSEMVQLPHVKMYETVIPQRLHQVLSQRDLQGLRKLYPEHAQYTLTVEGKNYTLKLLKNRELLAKQFTVTYNVDDGTEVTETQDGREHCFYHGHVDGQNDSSASINLCKGINGFMQVDGQMYLIEPLPGSDDDQGAHAVYKHEHLRMKRGACQGSNTSTVYDYGPKVATMLKPQPWRSAPLQTGTRYVELFLVVDNAEYLKYKDIPTVQHRMKEIVNHVDKLYRSLNFRVALIGMEIWTKRDKIVVSSNAGVTLDNFLSWRKSDLLRKKMHDNAQFVTGVDFEGSTVGLATKLAMCTGDSGAVNQDHSTNAIGAASTMAHEMGHNLGMSHDEDVAQCTCAVTRDKGGCVMSKSVGIVYPKIFSSCSQQDLQTFLSGASPTCLSNVPDSTQLFGGPVCGNEFVESGEECDCGTPEECTNTCCNATTCKLKEGAECAQGDCCRQCKIRPVGEMCRKRKGECDLPEYCTGNSAQCPEDAFQENGLPCSSGNGYCYNGLCPSLGQHCKTLWGSDAQVAPDECFRNNVHGNKHLHCKKTEYGYSSCKTKDVKCGRIHCVRGAEFPITNNKYVIKLLGGQECKVAELSDQESGVTADPGMVPTGTKCGMGMVCFEGECQDLSVYGDKNCSAKCNNRGVCNHKRQCHCDPGWAPPYCDHKFTENSADRTRGLLIVGILVAVCLFAVMVAGAMFYYRRRQRKFPQKRMATPGSGSGLSNPLFQESMSNKLYIRKDSPSPLIGRPQLIASTSNLQDSRSAFITIVPSEDTEKTPSFISTSQPRVPISVPRSPQVTKPPVVPPGPPGRAVLPPAKPPKPTPPTKPLPMLKPKPELKQKPSASAPLPPLKPSALKTTPHPMHKVALRPPIPRR
ncbi:Disintegrin and metalloproteinase domain-containing protein 8 [Aquarana catesbeiana]|uniref:Disintegrin and metalloproteinase domain-containing protein 8 n=1 Tax=Aquarana catesbeiana TaxID=8400 RepID=A0A2G9S3S2_AQUCT|nr:Disintegrin and metalloproteinase domain-containing protein 8 [Aquarana catesbeiana]